MILQLHLPNHEEALAFNRKRWAEVLLDPQWNDYSGKIETNGFGQIVMTPPPEGSHCVKQFRIALQLQKRMSGTALAECPISTVDGVRAADAAWYSEQRYVRVRGQLAFEIAPEICVDVLSPSNTEAQMKAKRQLYFAAGAIECWTCDLEGRMTYYELNEPNTPKTQSTLCPDFPSIITD